MRIRTLTVVARAALIALFVLAASASLTGCLFATQKPVQVPQIVAIQSLDVLKQAGVVATSIRAFERDLVARNVIPGSADAKFQAGFKIVQAAADKAIDLVAAGAITLSKAAQLIADTLDNLLVNGQAGIKALVDGLKLLLKNAGAPPVPVPITP